MFFILNVKTVTNINYLNQVTFHWLVTVNNIIYNLFNKLYQSLFYEINDLL